jgi:SAM-dependent methyltransferase
VTVTAGSSRVDQEKHGACPEHGMESVKCAVCHESETVLLFESLHDMHYGGSGSFSVRRCRRCDLAWVSPRPNREGMRDYYRANYSPYQDRAADATRAFAPLRRLLSFPYRMRYGRLDQVSFPPRPGARMLDIGCSTGQLLESMRNIGWDVWGIEMDTGAARKAAIRAGGEERVFVGSVGDAQYPKHSFDLVTASHVLEHLHDPITTLTQIHTWLCPGGQLRIWVPNVESIESKIFGPHWSGLDIPRHLYHFSPTTLSRLLDLTAFEINSWRPQFQGSSFGNSLKQALASFLRRGPGPPATGLIYNAATPVGWIMCGLGSASAVEVLAVARATPTDPNALKSRSPAGLTVSPWPPS